VAHARINGDWTFEMSGITGRRRLQSRRGTKGLGFESRADQWPRCHRSPAIVWRKDQSLSDVEVVQTSRVTLLSGTVADDHARPAPGQ
jgi:hypothetical protein